MRMRKYTLTLAFAFCSMFAMAQNHFSIKGSIENVKQEKLAYTSVTLYNADNNAYVVDVVTDENGAFDFSEVADGKYKLVITEFGYAQYEQIIDLKDGAADLGTIQLVENKGDQAVELKGVFIRKETSQYRNEIDKRVVEVGNDLVSAGTDAASVLNNIPSVNVDQQSGALSLRGNENVRVFVDGKPTSQSAAELLKQIPSNQIQRVEIITNPSAKYEADGKSGIINIILVKGQKKGYNVGLTTGYEQGKKSRFNSSINSNVNVGDFNFFGNLNYAKRPRIQHGIGQNFTDEIDQLFEIKNQNTNLSYKVGFDWFINDKNALTIYTNQWDGDADAQILTDIVTSNINRNNLNELWSNYKGSDYSLNYKLDFDKDDHNIVLDAFYSKNKNGDDRDYTNTYPFDNFYSEARLSDTNNTRINLDYTNQIVGAGKIEAGLQFRNETLESGMNSTLEIVEDGLTFNPNVDFEFDRKFFSGYANYKQKFNKFGAQVGLRLERVEDQAEWLFSPANRGELKKDYMDFFPSAFLTYDLTDKAQISFNYSRRIDRPGMYQLTPVPQFTTALMSSKGNPELRPEYTNSIELGYLHQLGKGSISANVFYRHVSDNIIQTFTKDPEQESAFIQYNMNYDKVNNYGIEASLNYRFTKWMSTFVSGDFTSSQMQSVMADANNNPTVEEITANVLTLRMNNNFTLSKNFTLQHFMMYNGKTKFLQGEMLDMWMMNLGLRYTFMEGKASLSARMNDIFNTMRARVHMNNPYIGYANFNWESQTFYLGFTYNFGGKVKTRAEVQKNQTEVQGGNIGI